MFKLFKKPEPKERTTTVNELHNWLDEELSQVDFSKEITSYFENLHEQKRILKEKNEELRIAQVSEKDKVEDRVRSIVIGQKNSFVTEVGRFTENLQISEEQKIRPTINFNTQLNKALDELAQKTNKSYQATTHLFYHQVQEVYKAIGEINLQVKKLKRKIEKKKLDKIENAILLISKLQEREKTIQYQKEELEQKTSTIQELKKEKETRQATIQKIKASPEYAKNNQQQKEKTTLQNQLNENNEEIHKFFSKLGRALRKYKKISMEHVLIGNYLESPIESLRNDLGLKIVTVLQALTNSINKKEVELNEKQEKNTLEQLKKVEEGYLNIKVEENKQLQEQINTIQIDNTLELQISGEEDKITNIENELTKIEEFKQKLKPPENGEEKAKLIALAEELFNTKLKIRKTI